MPITTEQLIEHKETINKTAAIFEELQGLKFKVYGKIFGNDAYQGEQKELNLLIDKEVSSLVKGGFEIKLQQNLLGHGIACSVALVSTAQLEEEKRNSRLSEKDFNQIIDKAVPLDDLREPENNTTSNFCRRFI